MAGRRDYQVRIEYTNGSEMIRVEQQPDAAAAMIEVLRIVRRKQRRFGYYSPVQRVSLEPPLVPFRIECHAVRAWEIVFQGDWEAVLAKIEPLTHTRPWRVVDVDVDVTVYTVPEFLYT